MRLAPCDALLLTDVQKDFLPGGALGLEGGNAVVPLLNQYVRIALSTGAKVFATRDWHPPDHCSFRAQGGPWPPHCIQGTPGAEFAAGLALPHDATVVSKGTDRARDAYSAFDGTDLDELLRARDIERVAIGGFATDYCVLRTAHDAVTFGYRVLLLDDAVRGVKSECSAAARTAMLERGAVPVTVDELRRSPPLETSYGA
jgi:nicotinamidase/pyrazinamidase